MIGLFDISDVNQSASTFSPEKLLWVNQQHIIAAPVKRLGKNLVPYLEKLGLDPAEGPDPADVAKGFKERAATLLDMAVSARYCYEDFEVVDARAAKKHLRPVILEPLIEVRKYLEALEEWSPDEISRTIEKVASGFDINMGKLGQPLRVAVTGGPVSPPIDVTLWLVGRERSLKRLDQAIELIAVRAAAGAG